MKRARCFLLWMSGLAPLWGQWNGINPVWTNSSVGIGIQSPVQILHTRVTSGDSVWRMDTATKAAGVLKLVEATGDVAISTDYLAHAIHIRNAGNVGIGTTTPQYRLTVEGSIGARDVIVTNAPWSDHVFRPGYRLRPLSEVASFIRQHGRLPEIPSEAEVKAKGVSVAEVQAKLLAKIEELTLHIIRQEERIAQLESSAKAAEVKK